MEQNKIDLFLLKKGELFPSNQVIFIREKLQKVPDEKWAQLSILQFKNPTTAIMISAGAGTFGADRFYINQLIFGCCKLGLFLVFFVSLICFEFNQDSALYAMLFILSMMALLLWYFIDIFLISKEARQYNYNSLLTFLI